MSSVLLSQLYSTTTVLEITILLYATLTRTLQPQNDHCKAETQGELKAWSPSQKQMDCIYVHKFYNDAKGLDPPGLDTKKLCVARLCGAGEKRIPMCLLQCQKTSLSLYKTKLGVH